MDKKNKYTHRFLARIVIKAETPIAVSSGGKDVISDKLILRDVNGLPYLPGTTIAGIVRHALDEKKAQSFFGYSAEDDPNDLGRGSEIIFSSAYIVDKDKRVVEGLISEVEKSDYLHLFDELPVRQHVAINDKGVNKSKGKFDEEVVYKGTHFCFEIEMLSDGKNCADFDAVLDEIASDVFRIGSGTRKGFGKISIVECKRATLNLENISDRKAYLKKSASLNDNDFWDNQKNVKPAKVEQDWLTYRLLLEPDDFYLFGSGFGDDDADMTPVSEICIDWNYGDDREPVFQHQYILIPGTSIKGALSHRIAFHYNKMKGFTIREVNGEYVRNENAKVGVDNYAVNTLFGYTIENENNSKRGNVIFSDLMQYQYEENRDQIKLLNHVAIDRFTGGAIDGALFSEKTVYGCGQTYELEILVNKNVLFVEDEEEQEERDVIKKAFERSLNDIVTGMLPLGGGVNRGNGCFSGSWTINE